MRSIRHWTPKYIKNRIGEIYYQKTCPDHPWMTQAANQILATYLKDSDHGLETGSGRSTLWFSKRTKHLTSIDHDETWYNKVSQMLKESGQSNVEYHLIPMDLPEERGEDAAYPKIINTFKTESFDYVLIDGVYRDFCALNALKVLRPGGVLIIDNVNWFLPSNTQSPFSRNSRPMAIFNTWDKVYQTISQWRRIWTTSGINDTALFFKPYRL